jgi:hypothetical protein
LKYAVEILGLEGFELMVSMEKHLDDFHLGWALEKVTKLCGNERALGIFHRLPARRIARILDQKSIYKPPVLPTTIAEVIRLLEQGEYVGPIRRWAKEDDWKELAKFALKTTEPETLRRVARLLSKDPWPLDVEVAFNRALEEQDQRSRSRRLYMLEGTRSQTIRSWALGQIKLGLKSEDFFSAFGLLQNNAAKRDLPLISAALFELRNDWWALHYAAIDAKSLRCGPTIEILQFIYEHGPCELCRYDAYKLLSRRGALSREQILECVEDSNEATRKLARRKLRSQKLTAETVCG